jgi:acetyltransferase-like isoleucine patch superfamily enzyme
MIVKIIEKQIARLKNDPDYKIDATYSFRELMYSCFYRLMQVMRGYFLKCTIHSKGLIFSGRRVKIEYGFLIRAGKSLIIEDEVFLSGLSKEGIVLGDNVTIARSSVLTCTGVLSNKGTGIKIGNNCAIGASSFLGGQGGIVIGDNVIMGPQVKIFSENHNYGDSNIVIKKQGETRLKIQIGENCWVGSGTIILAGVTIGEGSVIAAGSVVTKSFPVNSVIAGIPAKFLKSRIEN